MDRKGSKNDKSWKSRASRDSKKYNRPRNKYEIEKGEDIAPKQRMSASKRKISQDTEYDNVSASTDFEKTDKNDNGDKPIKITPLLTAPLTQLSPDAGPTIIQHEAVTAYNPVNKEVSDNKGNELEMARAIENIPQHCFNNHTNCGEWCRYLKDPDSISIRLFTLAKKASDFSAGVSSNPNENFNCTVASKAPKSKMYGTSASYSFRVDFAVNKKNDGEKFILRK
ncbi:hypothetical protein PV328_001165 [Microctonus aethiopoides]|uniref:Uncharacterized protein n=1 Tax=Microctonus aethiopoides TaxID=144406 RepID=A0AA39KXC6_9HYME|nr:hypothetical protein PV328_001165 [Microctonus aethiopoides]